MIEGESMSNKVSRVKKITPLAETRFLSLYNAEYLNKKGVTRYWTIASRKDIETLNAQFFEGKEEKIDAVIIISVHKDSKKLVLVKQFRVPLNDYVYELPAGLVDGDEDILKAVKRELKEETGLKVIKVNASKTTKGLYVSVGMTDESVALVYCLCEGEISKDYLEDDEDIEVVMVSQEEAKELLEKDIKLDIKAFMTIQSFVAMGEDLVNA